MTRIDALRWEGGLDGLLHLTCTMSAPGPQPSALVFDRPGDIVATCTGATFPSERHLAAVAFYGVVIASRGVPEVTYIRPIVDKTVKFMASMDISSLILMRELSRLKTQVGERDLEGEELRRFVLDEARAMHRRALDDV